MFMVLVGCISVGDYRGMGSQTYLPFYDGSVAATFRAEEVSEYHSAAAVSANDCISLAKKIV